MIKKQKGFLAIAAVLVVLLVGVLGAAFAYMFSNSANSTLNFAQAENALYLAEAGFEETARRLLTPILTGSNNRIACAAVTGNAALTAAPFGAGTFTAATVSGSPVYASTTLTSAITSTSTIIPVLSTTGFASAGRINIDGESINYGAISGNNFISVQRGINTTSSYPHASGAYVAEYQCNVDVKGGIPSVSAPLYQREIQQAVSLEEAWAAGATGSGQFVLTRWNRPTELTWTNSSFSSGSAANLAGIFMLSNAEGWAAAGNSSGSNFIFLRWRNPAWSVVTAAKACSSQTLRGISAVDSNEAWAVGTTYRARNGPCTNNGGIRRYTVVRWNGTNWSVVTPPVVPLDSANNRDLNAVHVIDANQSGAGTLGFAVGNNGNILRYNGTGWNSTVFTSSNLRGVYVVSNTEAWAVGSGGTILKWNGVSWSSVASPTSTQLNAVFMLDTTQSGTASIGWAVGNAGAAVFYNGSSWSLNATGSSANLFGVAVSRAGSTQKVWAVGASGTVLHYNGTTWQAVPSGTTRQLNAISLIAPPSSPFAWREIFS